MSNESRLEIREQPEPTCPMIDEIIKSLDGVSREIRGFKKVDDAETLRDMLDSVDSALFCWDSIEDKLEAIRNHVDGIRKWGDEWKRLALKIEEEAAAA